MRSLTATAIAWITAPLGAVIYLVGVFWWQEQQSILTISDNLGEFFVTYLVTVLLTTLVGLPIHAVLVGMSCRSVFAYAAAGFSVSLILYSALFVRGWYRVESWSIHHVKEALVISSIALPVAALFALIYIRLTAAAKKS